MTDQEQKAYALEYIANHPSMESRTKTILAEIVKGELNNQELMDLVYILLGLQA